MDNNNYIEELWKKRSANIAKKRKNLKIIILIGVAFMLVSLFTPISSATPKMRSYLKSSEYLVFKEGPDSIVLKSDDFQHITPFNALDFYNKLNINKYDLAYNWILTADLVFFFITITLLIFLTAKKPSAILIILSIVCALEYLLIWSISGADMFFTHTKGLFVSGISPVFGFGGAIMSIVGSILIIGCISSHR